MSDTCFLITVCNNRFQPDPVVMEAIITNEQELVGVNAAIQYLLRTKRMFDCARFLAGRRMTADLAEEYLLRVEAEVKTLGSAAGVLPGLEVEA